VSCIVLIPRELRRDLAHRFDSIGVSEGVRRGVGSEERTVCAGGMDQLNMG
jgi:hypothetical protein